MSKVILTIPVLLVSLSVTSAHAQFAQESHTVTVEVTPSIVINISRPSLELVAAESNLGLGQQAMTAVDESTVLSWRINRRHLKITVQTDLAAPKYTLKVMAVNATAGTPAPERVLGVTPKDFILDVGKTTGTAVIRYTGTASLQQGSGSDLHLVTFTVTQQ
ncbi:MAG TPA: hypothetical protein VFG50_00990 [Rhodothermales bacterium]|nr:hypothetical protein [Rhodothermales bacterium]